jgi:hypothetical protein
MLLLVVMVMVKEEVWTLIYPFPYHFYYCFYSLL